MRRAWLAVAVVVLALGFAPAAHAHDPTPYYTMHWTPAKSVPMLWAPSFPGGEWRSRVANARGAWNRLSPNAPLFYDAGQSRTEMAMGNCSPAALGINQVHFANLDFVGHPLGVSWACYRVQPNGAHEMFGVTVAFDSGAGYDWYTGTGNPGHQQYDLRSVATHEFGHLTGFVGDPQTGTNMHFDGALCVPVAATYQTMCAGTYQGANWTATLGDHDRHTLLAAYG